MEEKEALIQEDKSHFSSLFFTLKDYLNKLLFCNSFVKDLKTLEEESLEFLLSSLLLFKRLSEISGISEGVNGICSKFQNIIPKKIEDKDNKDNERLKQLLNALKDLSLEGRFNNEDELEDEVNYLYIWTLNSYKIDLRAHSLEEIKSQFGSEAAQEVDLNSQENVLNQEDYLDGGCCGIQESDSCAGEKSKNWLGYSVYKNLFRTEKWSFGNSKLVRDENSFEYIVLRSQALERLEREVRRGKVYIYLTKPLRNLKIKKVFSFLLLFGIIFSFVAFLKVIVSGGFATKEGLFGDASLFSLMSFLFFLLSVRENNKFKENENFKYRFSNKIFYYFFFLSTFFIPAGSRDFGQIFNSDNIKDPIHMVVFVVLISLLITSICLFLFGFFFLNPKKNKVLIENLLNKYSNPPYLNN